MCVASSASLLCQPSADSPRSPLQHFSTMFFRSEQVEAVAEQAREAFKGVDRRSSRVFHAQDGLRLLVEAGGTISIAPDLDR